MPADTSSGAGAVELRGVGKSYAGQQALAPVDLRIEQGEFFSLLGPSGCGKTTMVRLIAGFMAPTGGRVLLSDRDVTDLPAEDRNIGIVVQSYALFPQMNVFENVAFGLRLRGIGRREIADRVTEVLARVDLAGLERRFERELSGGQRQRVALARAIVIRPRLLLLDEPLSALDRRVRESTRNWLHGLQRELGITTIFVTHDQEEALAMSDRIAVLNAGRVEQVGTPTDIYERPATRFVAEFIGETNILPAIVQPGTGREALVDGIGTIVLGNRAVAGRTDIVVRPETLSLAADDSGGGSIIGTQYQGAQLRYRVAIGGHVLICSAPNLRGTPPFVVGDRVRVTIRDGSAIGLAGGHDA